MSSTYLVFGALAVKPRFSRSGIGVADGSGTRGDLAPAQPQPGDAVLAHDPSDALVVHALALVAQLGGDPGAAVGAVPLGVHGPDPLGERGVGPFELGDRSQSGIEAGWRLIHCFCRVLYSVSDPSLP